MKCLLCSLQFIREVVLKKHYVWYHAINPADIFFKYLFLSDTIDKNCHICKETFKSYRIKKKHRFLFYYGQHQLQLRGRRQGLSALPLNVLKRGSITYYSINFIQHKSFMIYLTVAL